MKPVRLLIIDDHFVVRSGLAASLDLEDDIEVVGEVERGEDACAAAKKTRADVVLMDLQLPGISGVEATAQLLAQDESARVLIFSTFARDEEILAALRAGDDLLNAIRSVAAGETSFAPDIAARLSERQSEPDITPRELEILTLVTQGNANKEIAARLGISEDTVKQHVSRILQKLRVNDRAQATAEAIRRGLPPVDRTTPTKVRCPVGERCRR